jgi:anthranilate synthase component I
MLDQDKLSFETFKALAKTHARVAIHQTLSGTDITPEQAYIALKPYVKNPTLLAFHPNNTHLCFDPITTIKAHGQSVTIEHGKISQTCQADPFELLRSYQAKLACQTTHPACGYLGGMVGFMSYDAIRLIEDIPSHHANHDDMPDMLFRFYKNSIAFDKKTQQIILSTVVSIKPHQLKQSYLEASRGLNKLEAQLLAHQTQPILQSRNALPIHIDTDDKTYCKRVEQAKHHVLEGDVFQVVLSRKFSIKTKAQPFDIYQALSQSNPAPYQFYLEFDDTAVAGTSPEKLISIQDGIIESRPLAGTRKRGSKPDHILTDELLHDPKELAEHMMLVDLARNDLGRIAVPGSVRVTQLKNILTCKAVLHLASTVQGRLKEDCDVFDALKASFPAGTLSGAPKIRAMELIDMLETTRRDLYGGVICAIDNKNNLESAIIIRTACMQNGVASVRAGAGIVHDSDPKSEARETYHKARAVLEGITSAGGIAA